MKGNHYLCEREEIRTIKEEEEEDEEEEEKEEKEEEMTLLVFLPGSHDLCEVVY